jgi:putative ABC transport system permease protein
METLLQDVRYGARMLRKNPGFTAVAVVALALGIGANTAIFSVVNAVLLRPLAFPEPDRLVTLAENNLRRGVDHSSVSYPNFADWREQNASFESAAASMESDFNTSIGDQPERVQAAIVSASLFHVLGVEPVLGRGFTDEEDRPGAGPVVVLGYGFWQQRFGGDPGVIGRSIPVEGLNVTIVGVMPAGFRFPVGTTPVPMLAPLSFLSADMQGQRGAHFLSVVARLRPGVTLEQARADMDAIGQRLAAQYPDSNTDTSVTVTLLHERLVTDVRPALLVLLGAVGFVLLIACANVANLLLVRSTARRKEIAIRAALGAGRWRVVRALLTESTLLACLGGALGLLLAIWGTDVLISVGPTGLVRVDEISVDGRVLGFTVAVSLVTGIVFGLLPALHASRIDLSEALKEGGANRVASARDRVRSALVVTEVALSVVLLIGAGLMVRSFARLLDVDPGFRPDHVVTAQLTLPDATYTEPQQVAAFYDRVLDRLRQIPGVQSAGAVTTLPLDGSRISVSYEVEGQPTPPGLQQSAGFDAVSPGYFRTLGIPILTGRDFTDQDRADGRPVIIVNEAMARRCWPGQDPIGKRITSGITMDDGDPPVREVVGVVGDVRHNSLSSEARAAYYIPFAQVPMGMATLAVRTAAEPAAVTSAMRAAVRDVDSNQPLYNARVMEQVVAESVATPRFYATLLGIFGAVALVLAAVGIYGVMAYSVTQRTHEIGVRIALGAQPLQVLRLVVGHGLALALVGVGIGLAAAFALTRLMSSMLFGVSATDPLTFGGLAALLVGVALLACYVPARRASRVDPMVALRYE